MTQRINADFPWLKKTWMSFLNLYSQNRLPQTFLISGIKGIGKENLVQKIEQLLLCMEPKQDGACGKCRSCHLYTQETHPDYRILGKEEIVGIDEIREIGEFINQTSHQAGRRIITLKQVDKLHPSAANALLKNLEEPPTNLVFLLVAERSTAVLATIQSRAFKIAIPIPSKDITLMWLKENHPMKTQADLEWCLTLSGGSPLKAEDILNTEHIDKRVNLLCEILFLKKKELIYHKEMQQFFSNQPEETLQLIYYMLTKLIYHIAAYEKDVISKLLDATKLKIVAQFSIKQILIYLEKVNKTIQELTLPGINKLLLLETLLLKDF